MAEQRFFGTIQKRGNRYRGRYRHKGKTYYTPTRTRKREVEGDLAREQTAILDGTWKREKLTNSVEPRGTTLQDWASSWLSHIENSDYSPSTYRAYSSIWKGRVSHSLEGRQS